MGMHRAISLLLLLMLSTLLPLAHAGLTTGPFVPEKALKAIGAPLIHRARLPGTTLADMAEGIPATPAMGPVSRGDVAVSVGSEVGVTADPGNPDNLAAVFNRAYINSPSLAHSADGDQSWAPVTFPAASGDYTYYPTDPWAAPGIAPGELFSSLLWVSQDRKRSHAVVARSVDGGTTWSKFFEEPGDVFQDRDMFDVDRSTASGGGSGSAFDDVVYLAYDAFGVTGEFEGPFLEVVGPTGQSLRELPVPNLGYELQPVAGIADGQVVLMGRLLYTGGQIDLLFGILRADQAEPTFLSTFSFRGVGQALGNTGSRGVNGFREGADAQLAIDRSAGPHHGFLYLITNRNPNPDDVSRDQGDVWLSISSNGVASWSGAFLPTAAGKTQYFPMIAVDDNGWLHVAYYQNETGSQDDGVLNASTANVYYMLSKDGGVTWSEPIAINDPGNALMFEDPPPDRSGGGYYLIGDYQQIVATGSGDSTRAHVCWSGYRIGEAPQVRCTTVLEPVCGNGIVEPGEECDDGNRRDGDCCSAECKVEPAGSPCSDGDPCTLSDVCVATTCRGTPISCPACLACVEGECVANARKDCAAPAAPRHDGLSIVHPKNAARDRLAWTWRGARDIPWDPGDPLTKNDLNLCLFDESTAPRILLHAIAPAASQCGKRPCWSQKKGVLGYAAGGPISGLRRIILDPRAPKGRRIMLAAGGDTVALPPSGPLPVPLRLQLQVDSGGCWEAVYASARVNNAHHFSAGSPPRAP
jgi:cysteine-rich repeat protein